MLDNENSNNNKCKGRKSCPPGGRLLARCWDTCSSYTGVGGFCFPFCGSFLLYASYLFARLTTVLRYEASVGCLG